MRIQKEEQETCSHDTERINELHKQEALRKEIICGEVDLTVPAFVDRVKQLRFLKNQVRELVSG